jgi:glycosyltransferase involved in cell wall biosynthesis
VNLLFVTPYFAPLTYGGIESQVATLARSMATSHRCTIAAPGTLTAPAAAQQGVSVYRTPALLATSRRSADLAQLPRFFTSICETHEIEAIVAHNLHTWVAPEVADALHLVATSRAIPVVLRVHNFCGPRALERVKSLPWAKVLCVSAMTARALVQGGVAGGRVSVLYTPIDTTRFRPAPDIWLRLALRIPLDRAIVLHASRMVGGTRTVTAKGVPALLRAMSQVKAAHLVLTFPPASPQLQHALDHSLREIRRLAARLSIQNRVHFVSATHSQMPRVYNGAQVFAMLSELEALGSVYLEAAACGLPAIGTDVGGVREAVEDAVTGFVVTDVDGAATALETLVRDAALRRRLGDAGRARVRSRFAANGIASKLAATLERVANGACEGSGRA